MSPDIQDIPNLDQIDQESDSGSTVTEYDEIEEPQ